MIICAHQPVYLPSLHLFNKISLCEGFVLLGHCQFVKQSWQTRNKIRSGKGSLFLTVPVKQIFGQRLENTIISSDHWKRKHLRSIRETYSKRPFFRQYYPTIEDIISRPHKTLTELNNALILKIMEWLDLTPKVFYSETLGIQGQKTDMLINICKSVGADKYISNDGAKVYLEEDAFRRNNIKHYWQDFSHPTYDQGKTFIPNLSILDALFNMGPACIGLVKDAGTFS